MTYLLLTVIMTRTIGFDVNYDVQEERIIYFTAAKLALFY